MGDTSIQQTPFVKQLAANDRPTRDAAVASLKSYLSAKRTFTRLDFMKLWKGLFYCMWMSDRPKTQQNLANELAALVDVLSKENYGLFMSVYWTTMAREWSSIDVLRMDKFLLLVRRYLAASLRYLQVRKWDEDLTSSYMTVLETIPLHPTNLKIPNGLRYHIIDIYLDEIEKLQPDADSSTSVNNTPPIPPIDLLMQPLCKLKLQTPTKPVRLRIQDMLNDERLKKWGFVGSELPVKGGRQEEDLKHTDKDEEMVDDDDEEEEEEWGGIDE